MAGFGTTKLSPKAREQKKKLQQKYPSADLSNFGQQRPEDQGLLAPLAWFKDGDLRLSSRQIFWTAPCVFGSQVTMGQIITT